MARKPKKEPACSMCGSPWVASGCTECADCWETYAPLGDVVDMWIRCGCEDDTPEERAAVTRILTEHRAERPTKPLPWSPPDMGPVWPVATTEPTKASRPTRQPGVVYFVGPATMDVVKIGTTTNLSSRLAALRCGSPVEIVLHAQMPGGRAEEKELHARFSGSRKHGEWFELTEEIRQFMLAV